MPWISIYQKGQGNLGKHRVRTKSWILAVLAGGTHTCPMGLNRFKMMIYTMQKRPRMQRIAGEKARMALAIVPTTRRIGITDSRVLKYI